MSLFKTLIARGICLLINLFIVVYSRYIPKAQTPVSSLEEEFKRLNRSLQKEVDKCLETQCYKEYQLILTQAQKIQYFSPPYLQRVREMVEAITNSYTEFLLKIQVILIHSIPPGYYSRVYS